MRRLILSYIFLFAILGNFPVQANIFPSDPIELKQPNGITFQARFFGDEFLSWAETLNGYTIAINPSDGYWYFAQRGLTGNLVASLYQVGKIDPMNIGLEQHLRPSQEIIALAAQEREEFNANLVMRSTTGTKTLGVILIEFPDEPGVSYSNNDYWTLFFSEGVYNQYSPWPDRERVFGSIRDYFLEVSYGQLSITGDILNNSVSESYQWLMADSIKHFYSFNTTYKDTLIKEAVEKARTAHQSIPGFKNPDDYDIICVYYAGDVGAESGALWMHCATDTGYKFAYINGEKTYQSPHTFNHIGGHCHEIGHQLGLTDKYTAIREAGYYGVMGKGNWNGPNGKGECAAHITAVGKIQLGWVSPHIVNSNTSVTLNPVENNSTDVYKIISENTLEYSYYVLENRTTINMFSSFDQYLPGKDDCAGGLIIWKLDSQSSMCESFVPADNDFKVEVIDGGDYFPGTTNNSVFNGISCPSSNFGTNSNIASGLTVHNIVKNSTPRIQSISCDLMFNQWSGKIITSLSWDGQIEVIGNVFVHADTVLDTFFVAMDQNHFQQYSKPETKILKHNYSYLQNMGRAEDVILTIQSGSHVNLNGNYVKSAGTQGGVINRESNVTFNPDIQLFENGTTLIGQYSTIQQAITDASAGDEIIVNSDLNIDADIDLPGGYLLTISPGVSLQFAPATSLNVYGKLYAWGAWNNRIGFDCSNPSSYWLGIKFHEGSDENSRLCYCDISHATFGIFMDRTTPGIRYYNTISNCVYGIYGRYACPDIDRNDVDFSAFIGINLQYVNAVASWHILMNQNSLGFNHDGIYLYQSDAFIWNYNNICGSSNCGIYANDFCDLQMNYDYYPGEQGYNTIESCGGPDIWVNYQSDAWMNTQWHWLWFQETQRITGDNERIKANDNCWVVAESCWWGDPSPDPGWFVASNNSDIDWMFPLDHDPAMGFNSNNATLTTTINSSGQAATYSEMLRFALELIHRAEYDSAAAICDSLIQSDPGAPGTIHAFSILWRSYRRSARSGFVNILNSYITNYSSYELSGAARRIRAILASARGNVTEAIQSLIQVKNDFRGTSTHKHALYDLIDLHLFDLDDVVSAQQLLAEMELEFPGDDLTQRASYLIDPHQLGLQKPSEKPLTYSNENQIAVEFALQQNYPNPFNAETEILYQLPQACQVTIEIYNSLGQKIRTVVDKAQPAGFYSVVWDGRNEHGIPVASGIYLYLIRANQYHEVKKMLLLR